MNSKFQYIYTVHTSTGQMWGVSIWYEFWIIFSVRSEGVTNNGHPWLPRGRNHFVVIEVHTAMYVPFQSQWIIQQSSTDLLWLTITVTVSVGTVIAGTMDGKLKEAFVLLIDGSISATQHIKQ